MKSKKLRVSLRTKFILIFVAILLITIGGIAVANKILLGRLYEDEKHTALIEAYETINVFYLTDNSSELELEKIYSSDGITIYICNEYGEEVYSSSRDAEIMMPMNERYGRPEGLQSQPNEPPQEPPHREGERGEERRNFRDRRPPFAEYARELIGDEDYVVQTVHDERLGAEFIQLTGELDNDNFLYLRTPMAPVDEAAETANELLIFIGIAALLIGSVIVAIAASAATRPIRQLRQIAVDMSAMNFERKYEGKSRDEVGELGQSINILSEKLEEIISQLRESNAQLEKDIELKNSIDKMRKEFIANASHELKTPIALAAGYAEGLKENIAASPEDRDFYCDVIIDETARMDKVIKQILTIAELESADAERLEKTRLSFSGLVESAVRSFDILARRKDAVIELNCQSNVEVVADEVALTQAVNNYITNAINHVDDNHIIKVFLSREGEKARFSVYNSGAQIPESSAEYIWGSFAKLDKARTRAYGGSGLGLAIVKRIVELHGGSCGFVNVEDGVEFYFTL